MTKLDSKTFPDAHNGCATGLIKLRCCKKKFCRVGTHCQHGLGKIIARWRVYDKSRQKKSDRVDRRCPLGTAKIKKQWRWRKCELTAIDRVRQENRSRVDRH
jgi:hypothetical protein